MATEIDVIKEFLPKDIFDILFEYIMEDEIEPIINKKINQFLIIGAVMFVCNFLMMFLWSYLALRQVHWLKNNYFRIILNQEQGWFDENNAF
jgi:hypothetical protein